MRCVVRYQYQVAQVREALGRAPGRPSRVRKLLEEGRHCTPLVHVPAEGGFSEGHIVQIATRAKVRADVRIHEYRLRTPEDSVLCSLALFWVHP